MKNRAVEEEEEDEARFMLSSRLSDRSGSASQTSLAKILATCSGTVIDGVTVEPIKPGNNSRG